MAIEKIGFVGLGTMGAPMAKNLLRGGFAVTGFDIADAAVARHMADGGTGARSAAEAVDGADFVVTMLPDGPDVEAAVFGDNGILKTIRTGAILIDMSTIAPAVTRKIGDALTERGVEMVDSPVGKTLDHAIAGTLTLMVGGSDKTVSKVKPVLECMGSDIFHCGDLGMGGAMKLTNNFLAAIILAGTAEALVVGGKAGLDIDTMYEVMRTTMAWNNQLGVALPRKALAGDLLPGFRLMLAEKDQRLATEMASTLNVATPVGLATLQAFREGMTQGLAHRDISAILTMRQQQAGISLPQPRVPLGVSEQ